MKNSINSKQPNRQKRRKQLQNNPFSCSYEKFKGYLIKEAKKGNLNIIRNNEEIRQRLALLLDSHHATLDNNNGRLYVTKYVTDPQKFSGFETILQDIGEFESKQPRNTINDDINDNDEPYDWGGPFDDEDCYSY